MLERLGKIQILEGAFLKGLYIPVSVVELHCIIDSHQPFGSISR
jgi:hypothetical protein